jgi:hypothetical protein
MIVKMLIFGLIHIIMIKILIFGLIHIIMIKILIFGLIHIIMIKILIYECETLKCFPSFTTVYPFAVKAVCHAV